MTTRGDAPAAGVTVNETGDPAVGLVGLGSLSVTFAADATLTLVDVLKVSPPAVDVAVMM